MSTISNESPVLTSVEIEAYKETLKDFPDSQKALAILEWCKGDILAAGAIAGIDAMLSECSKKEIAQYVRWKSEQLNSPQ